MVRGKKKGPFLQLKREITRYDQMEDKLQDQETSYTTNHRTIPQSYGSAAGPAAVRTRQTAGPNIRCNDQMGGRATLPYTGG